jgi:glycosyltransferase involved in cell wall biosynthesis
MTRVLIFSLAYIPHLGGAEVAVKEVAERMPSGAFSFDMITLRFSTVDAPLERVGAVTVHRIALPLPLFLNKLLFPLTAAFTGVRLHRARPYDIAWSIMAAYAGFATLLFHMATRVPYLLSLQEGDPLDFIKSRVVFVYPFFKMIFTRAAQVQAISDYLGAWAREMGASAVSVVPNGVNVALFSAPAKPGEVEEVLAGWGVTLEDVVLFTSSRLVKKNGIDTVIRALPHLPDNYHFVIAGDGPLEHELKALARSLKVERRVHFLGFVPHHDLPARFVASDVFVRPSRSEGMGNAFIEAFAAYTPVVATQVGGIPDFLFDPERNPGIPPTGLAVEPDDHQALASAVARLAEDEHLAAALASNAHALAKKKYEWDTIAGQMRECFDTVARSS